LLLKESFADVMKLTSSWNRLNSSGASFSSKDCDSVRSGYSSSPSENVTGTARKPRFLLVISSTEYRFSCVPSVPPLSRWTAANAW